VKRRQPRSTVVTFTIYVDDGEFEVEAEVSAGSPEIRWGDSACPADPGSVDILSVSDGLGALDEERFAAFVAEHTDRLDELAFEAAADAAEGDETDAAEHWAELAREDAMDRRMGR
jgi:DNA-binding SARP family transcriptional activator